MSAHLIVFAKNPVPGEVKTRLQTRYTPTQAAGIYRAFILDTLESARQAPANRHLIAYTPSDAGGAIGRLVGPGWDLRPQAETDLGERMFEAARQSFQQDATRVVIIGTDIPSLPPGHIRQAFDLLAEKDIVLGPSTDGGYYLVGLSHPHRSAFRDIDWSTERVFAQTSNRVEAAGLSLGLVPLWYDVDTPDELDFLLAHTGAMKRAGSPPAARHTRAYLSALT